MVTARHRKFVVGDIVRVRHESGFMVVGRVVESDHGMVYIQPNQVVTSEGFVRPEPFYTDVRKVELFLTAEQIDTPPDGTEKPGRHRVELPRWGVWGEEPTVDLHVGIYWDPESMVFEHEGCELIYDGDEHGSWEVWGEEREPFGTMHYIIRCVTVEIAEEAFDLLDRKYYLESITEEIRGVVTRSEDWSVKLVSFG